MKYLVTGGAGFIGSHLCDALIARGDSVVVLDDLSTGNVTNLKQLEGNSDLELHKGSILDKELVAKLVSSVDSIVHMAAAVGVLTIVDNALESLKVNLQGTENVLEAANKFGKSVLVSSTSEIYGKNTQVPLNEESDRVIGSPLKSRWSYSEAKAIDESLAYFYHTEKGLPVKIIRLFNTVGPRQVGTYGMVIPRFISAALKNENISVYGSGKQSRCFCHVADAIRAILLVLDSDKANGQVFNIGSNQEITISELAKKVISLTKSKSQIEVFPYEQAYSPGFEDMQRRVPDTTKIKDTLGWEPSLSLEDIVSDIVEYLRQK